MHWAIDYIGKPWAVGAQGPDAFDCWALVRDVQRLHFDRELPIIDVNAMDLRAVYRAFKAHPELERWQQVDAPVEGDIALLSSCRHPHHCGVWLDVDAGGLLHSEAATGVAFQDLASLRASGWSRLKYLRFTG